MNTTWRLSLLFYFFLLWGHADAQPAAPHAPSEDHFTVTTLVKATFFEPTEMTILPDLDILVAQRRGEILLYKHKTHKVVKAGFLDVYWKTLHTPKVNAEEGVLGIQADPDFANNKFVYIYYSPSDSSVNRLSRFTLAGDTLSAEKTVLEVKADREICCHTGGSIAFGPEGNLFVSTGDNSTPFDEPNTPYPSHGYAPLDDRPGHTQYDSRRGAGNTNDLRGKILRIKVAADGSYTIPTGNLFPPGEEKTRPEIYVMGDRNPYRISVDKKNGFLYWGEVGPDANNDSLDSRGPRGYDEFNQARVAGFFGWPLFVGNNYPYRIHDYATNVNGDPFDPAKPINDSRNNTGLRELPPAQPAFIWYPYGPSKEFPELGSGGRCAMAGPVYYADLYPDSTRLPDYFTGRLFIYDWVRGWFKVVTMKPNGDYEKMEPFMEHAKFSAPVDVEMGPDGRMYILEYGSGWFSKNADAGLVRIDYHKKAIVAKTAGGAAGKGGSVKAGAGSAGAGSVAAKKPAEGMTIMMSMDCKTCHKVAEKSIGPAFTDVAKKYAKDPQMVSKLMKKVIEGGSGNWGDVPMAAHPAINKSDLKKVILWIKTLSK